MLPLQVTVDLLGVLLEGRTKRLWCVARILIGQSRLRGPNFACQMVMCSPVLYRMLVRKGLASLGRGVIGDDPTGFSDVRGILFACNLLCAECIAKIHTGGCMFEH
jgi:hypothetical protein